MTVKKLRISTHALTWSATVGVEHGVTLRQHFNSRAHVERDAPNDIDDREHHAISTHALTWSATGRSHPRIYHQTHFNSRAHVERDDTVVLYLAAIALFQLTRSRGARPWVSGDSKVSGEISTHALTWSATFNKPLTLDVARFQLTRSRGARLVEQRHKFGE